MSELSCASTCTALWLITLVHIRHAQTRSMSLNVIHILMHVQLPLIYLSSVNTFALQDGFPTRDGHLNGDDRASNGTGAAPNEPTGTHNSDEHDKQIPIHHGNSGRSDASTPADGLPEGQGQDVNMPEHHGGDLEQLEHAQVCGTVAMGHTVNA